MTTLSVIIATHNRADLLAEALHSMLQQDRGDFEVLVVDDGCTDRTGIVVDTFVEFRDASCINLLRLLKAVATATAYGRGGQLAVHG